MTSDESLILQFKAGSRESFEELFERYQKALYRFFYRRLQGCAVAEELAQETWLAVLKGTVRYEPRARFRSYLFGIAFKLMLAERRKVSRQPLAGSDAMTASSAETDYWVREALQRLEPVEREILMLREYEQLSYEEIGALLQIPVNTVRSRLFRARLAARQWLEPSDEHSSKQETL